MNRFSIIFLIAGIVSLFLETTIVQFPLVLIFLLFSFFTSQNFKILLLTVCISFIFDMLRVMPIGLTGIFIAATVFLYSFDILPYDRKNPFLFLPYVVIASLIYSFVSQYPFSLFQMVGFFGMMVCVIPYMNIREKATG